MNLDHDFVQVWKFSEDQKKNANRTFFLPEFKWRPKKKRSPSKIEHFFSPILGEHQKKRSSARIEHFFPQIYAQLYTLSNYWEGCRSGPFSNLKLLGGYSQIIGGMYPPRVSAPLPANIWIVSTFQEFFSHAISWAHFTYRHHWSKRDQTNDTKTLKKCGCQTIKPNSIIFIFI